jgi:hypothetical protein
VPRRTADVRVRVRPSECTRTEGIAVSATSLEFRNHSRFPAFHSYRSPTAPTTQPYHIPERSHQWSAASTGNTKKKSTPSARETGGCGPDIPRRLLREGLSPYRPTTIRNFWGISNRQDGFSCNCFKVGHKDDIWPLSIYVNVQFVPVPT